MNIAQEIASKISSKYDVESKGSKSLIIDGETFTVNTFANFLNTDFVFDLGFSADTVKKFKEEKARLTSAIFKLLRTSAMDKKLNSMDMGINSDLKLNFNYVNHTLILDVVTGMEKLYNHDMKRVSNIDVDTWRKMLPSDQELRKAVMEKTVKGVIVYDPYSEKEISDTLVEGQKVHKFNAHIMPKWRRTTIASPELPEIFIKYITHLFPEEKARKYIYNWLHNMIVSRNEPILILNSMAGTGKNTFSKLCRSLVGADNHGVAPKGFLDAVFNSSMRHKRCFVFDEEKITSENINQLKNWTNDMVTFQSKGVDVKHTETNYASLLFTNNYIYNLYLTRDERKFSVVDMTDVRINTVFTEEELVELNDLIENDDNFIGNIGYWLIENGYDDTWGKHNAYISEAFHKVVHYSYSAWQRAIIELIESREYNVVSIEDFKYSRKELSEVSGEKIKNFIECTVDRDGDRYATTFWDNKERRRCLKIADKYKKVEISEQSNDDAMDF